MRRIFRPFPIDEDVPEVFRYSYDISLLKSMRFDGGVYYSRDRIIDLSDRTARKTMLVGGWNLENGNILSCKDKICECVYIEYKGTVTVAYTIRRKSNISIRILEIKKTDWDNISVNAFNHAKIVFECSDGYNSKLIAAHNAVLWHKYDSADAFSGYIVYNYDVVNKKTYTTTAEDCKHYPSLINAQQKGNSKFVYLPKSGMWCLHVQPDIKRDKSPAIVVCPGGPFSSVPDLDGLPELYKLFAQAGFHVIIPMRRGIAGIRKEWELSLKGHYGSFDVADIIAATEEMVSGCDNIVSSQIGLYGASYGGYSALLIAGKFNRRKLFNAIVCHCGVYDLENYPYQCSGIPADIMREYGNTTEFAAFQEQVTEINPRNFVGKWNVPVLLVHTLDDATTWFGQSVSAYNDAIKLGKKDVRLILTEGAHSYETPQKSVILSEIVNFYLLTNHKK